MGLQGLHGKTHYIYDVPQCPKYSYQIWKESIQFWQSNWILYDFDPLPPQGGPRGVAKIRNLIAHLHHLGNNITTYEKEISKDLGGVRVTRS